MLPFGTFGAGSITEADTITADSTAVGVWYAKDYTSDLGYAALASNPDSSQTRALAMCIPMPQAATYSLTSSVYRTTRTNQTTYWHVLAVQTGTTLQLGNDGVPRVISAAGVKSLKMTEVTDNSASLRWKATTENYTVSAADATAYQYLVFVFIGSTGSGNVLWFDNINTDAPYASVASDGLDCIWVNSSSAIGSLSSVSWASPVRTSKEPQINWMNTTKKFYPTGATQRFAMKLTGTITMPATGTWNFRVGSDDGSRVIVNGTTVINHDGLHSYSTRTGSLNLSKGSHTIEVQFFENTGNRGLRLEWQGPADSSYDVVPGSAFAAEVERRPRVVRWRETAVVD